MRIVLGMCLGMCVRGVRVSYVGVFSDSLL